MVKVLFLQKPSASQTNCLDADRVNNSLMIQKTDLYHDFFEGFDE